MASSGENNEYADRVHNTIRSGFLSLQLLIGHKLKIFDRLGDESQRKTSVQIAEAAGLKERYVREWLGGVVTGGFVECDPSGQWFWLTPAAVSTLSQESTKAALSVGMLMPHMGKVFEEVSHCARTDGPRGLPYSLYEGFNDTITVLADADHNAFFISHFLPSVPGLCEQLEGGIDFLDVGCGKGTAALLLAARFPKSRIYGLDIGENAIEVGRSHAREQHLSNIRFVAADAARMPDEWTSKFDYVMSFHCIHDVPRPDLVLSETRRVLKAGARLSVVDIYSKSNVYENKQNPEAPFLYTTSLFHCLPVSLYFEDGVGLGAMWGEKRAIGILKEAGFEKIELIKPMDDKDEAAARFNGHYLCTKPVD